VKGTVFVGISLVALAGTARGQTTEERKATVAYLQELQTREGAFRPTAKADGPSLRATSAALRALKYFGGEAKNPAGCADFVRGCFDKASGGFADTPGGKPDAILTAIGLMALVELKLPTADYEKPAIHYLSEHARSFEEVRMAAAGLEAVGKRSPKNKAWLEQLREMQNPDGTFGKGNGQVRATGGAVAAVVRLGGEVEKPGAVLKALNAGQRKDGGFGKPDADGSDLETTYRVTRTSVMLKARPARVEDCRKFVARCRNADGGYGVAPGQPSSVGGTYFAGVVLHWLGAK
jgi:prenyltransferase beta subunit